MSGVLATVETGRWRQGRSSELSGTYFFSFLMVAVMNQVNIYTTPNCAYCIAAKSLLSKKGVTYAEHNIGGDRVAAAALAESTGRRTVPQIFIGDAHVGGFDDLRALDISGRLDVLLGG